MTPERFTELADAYGGDPARWPEADRAAAAVFAVAEPALAAAVLAEAGRLDHALAEAPRAVASSALRTRILAAAPRPRAVLSWAMRAGLGAGLAFAGACGVAAGVMLSVTPEAPQGLEAATSAMASFDGLADDTTAEDV